MKKLLILLTTLSMFILSGCSNESDRTVTDKGDIR